MPEVTQLQNGPSYKQIWTISQQISEVIASRIATLVDKKDGWKTPPEVKKCIAESIRKHEFNDDLLKLTKNYSKKILNVMKEPINNPDKELLNITKSLLSNTLKDMTKLMQSAFSTMPFVIKECYKKSRYGKLPHMYESEAKAALQRFNENIKRINPDRLIPDTAVLQTASKIVSANMPTVTNDLYKKIDTIKNDLQSEIQLLQLEKQFIIKMMKKGDEESRKKAEELLKRINKLETRLKQISQDNANSLAKAKDELKEEIESVRRELETYYVNKEDFNKLQERVKKFDRLQERVKKMEEKNNISYKDYAKSKAWIIAGLVALVILLAIIVAKVGKLPLKDVLMLKLKSILQAKNDMTITLFIVYLIVLGITIAVTGFTIAKIIMLYMKARKNNNQKSTQTNNTENNNQESENEEK